MTTPAVSVIIPTYNGEKFLREAIESVFSQTYNDYELIVVDDGSLTDAPANICAGYRDRLKYIRQANRGVAAARNFGIREARGEYIAFLDDDDVWTPEKLKRQMAFMDSMKARSLDKGLIYTGLIYTDEEGNEIFRLAYRSSRNNYEALLGCDFIGTPSSVITRKDVLEEVGFFDETISGREDYDLWLRIAYKYQVHFIEDFLVRHREREGSMSKSPEKMIGGLQKILDKVISRDPENAEKLKPVLRKRICSESALRWKNAAYEWLLENKDAKKFRECYRTGKPFDSSLFGFKAKVYYGLSFVSPQLCIFLNSLRRPKRNETRIIEVP